MAYYGGLPAETRFKQINTTSQLRDGRVIQSSYSFPLGVGKEVYDEIVGKTFKAFGCDGTVVDGEFMLTHTLTIDVKYGNGRRKSFHYGISAVAAVDPLERARAISHMSAVATEDWTRGSVVNWRISTPAPTLGYTAIVAGDIG